MNPDYENELARRVDDELKALPDLAAPGTLAGRVMRVIEQRTNSAWYRQPWHAWPSACQAVSLALMLAAFAGICLLAWEFSRGPVAAGAVESGLEAVSRAMLVLNTLGVLAQALFLSVKQLGTGVLIACLLAATLSYSICVGLGTLAFHFAFSRRQKDSL